MPVKSVKRQNAVVVAREALGVVAREALGVVAREALGVEKEGRGVHQHRSA